MGAAPSPQQLANQLTRVEYVWPDDDARGLEPAELAAESAKHPQVLAIAGGADITFYAGDR
jgi:hypothetical protein